LFGVAQDAVAVDFSGLTGFKFLLEEAITAVGNIVDLTIEVARTGIGTILVARIAGFDAKVVIAVATDVGRTVG